MKATQEFGLAERCLEHVQALPFVRHATLTAPSPKDQSSIDALLSVETPQGLYKLPCEIRRAHLQVETAHALVHIAASHPGLIVIAPAIGRKLGDLLERADVNFVDVVGNCYVRLGDRYLARIQGRSASDQVRTGRGLRAPAYRALLALLVRPELIDAPSRAIAADADVSPQTANELRRRLLEQGIVLKAGGRHGWAPGRRKDAVALWLAGFTASLAPSLEIGRFRAKERDPVELERRIEPLLDALCDWRYGGGAAAVRLSAHYRGDRTVLYVRNEPSDLWTKLGLVRDSSGPILLAGAPCRQAFESMAPRCVHPLLAYADLLAEGHDRAREAAGELHARFLATSGQRP